MPPQYLRVFIQAARSKRISMLEESARRRSLRQDDLQDRVLEGVHDGERYVRAVRQECKSGRRVHAGRQAAGDSPDRQIAHADHYRRDTGCCDLRL